MNKTEEIRKEVRSAKSMLNKNLTSKAKEYLNYCIGKIQKIILEVRDSETNLLQDLALMLNKCYKYLGRAEKASRNYKESINLYQKAYNSISKTQNFPEATIKTYRELQEAVSSQPKKLLISKTPNKLRISSNIKSENLSLNPIDSTHKKILHTKRIKSAYKMPSISNILSGNSFKNLQRKPKAKILDTKKPNIMESYLNINKMLEKISGQSKISPAKLRKRTSNSKNSFEIIKTPEIVGKIFVGEQLAFETGTRIPVLNKKDPEIQIQKRGEEEKSLKDKKLCTEIADFIGEKLETKSKGKKFIIKVSKIIIKATECEVTYYLNSKSNKVTIKCLYNNEKYMLKLPFAESQMTTIEFIDKKIENFLNIVDGKLVLTEVSYANIAKGFVVDDVSYILDISVENIRNSFCISGGFVENFNENKEKNDIRNAFSQIFTSFPKLKSPSQTFSCVFVNEKQQICVDSLGNWKKVYQISDFAYKSSLISVKIYEFSKENVFYYILALENCPFVRIKKDIVMAHYWISASNSCDYQSLLNSIHFSDDFSVFFIDLKKNSFKKLEFFKLFASKSIKTINENGSSMAVPGLKILKIPSEIQFPEKYYKILVKFQRKFKKYLIDDRKKLVSQVDSIILKENKLGFEVSVIARSTACFIQLNSPKKNYYSYIDHKSFPYPRYFYVTRIIDSIVIADGAVKAKLYSKVFNFNSGIYDQIGDGRIIYRDCKIINSNLYRICAIYYESGFLEFIVTNKLDQECNFRIDIKTLSASTGLESQYLNSIVRFAIKNLIVIKEPGIIYLDLTKKFSSLSSIIKIQAFFRGKFVQKTFKRIPMKLLYKNHLILKNQKYTALIYEKASLVLLRVIRRHEVFGANLDKDVLSSEGLLSNLDFFFNSFIKTGLHKNLKGKIGFSGLEKYLSITDAYKYK
ncbi:hypothetical protein SteCoe_14917 [Stentor coeruleus]|uniref:Uncharacterized protein n=1 Tax=Stentor coeruleus TaxID=5963 RepID=A0A1R2C4X7_9CILI|nr:hypothetical protein SteCoe_14917 [Stentor coeruleus]